VRNVRIEIILQLRTEELILKELLSRNSVLTAELTQSINRLDKEFV